MALPLSFVLDSELMNLDLNHVVHILRKQLFCPDMTGKMSTGMFDHNTNNLLKVTDKGLLLEIVQYDIHVPFFLLFVCSIPVNSCCHVMIDIASTLFTQH